MDDEDDDASSFRAHMFDLSIKRSNSSPALPLLVNTAENDMQFDDADFCDAKLRRHSSSFSSHQSRLSRFAHIMKNELANPIVDEASQERDLHDNLKMSISFTDLAVGDEQQSQQPAQLIDSRRSSVNSSDSSNLCYSCSPSPSTPARACAVVSNQRQCYSPALQQQVAPFQCYLASPPSRSQSPIGMVTTTNNNNSSSTKLTSFPPNLKRKQADESTATTGSGSKKSRIGSDNESLFGPTNSPESPSGLIDSNSNLLTTQQSLNLLSSVGPSLSSSSSSSSSSSTNINNDNSHFNPIQNSDSDLFPPPNSPSLCPSPTNSTCSSSSSTFTPISPASTTCSSSTFLLLPANFNRSTVIPSMQSSTLIIQSTTNPISINTNYSKIKSSNQNQLQRDRSLDEPLSVLLPRQTTTTTQQKSPNSSSSSKQQFFFSSDDNNSTTAQ
ncbi:unnamed protein product [Rotaria magnacalcarata]|uniref:Uncharacterized protein n=3 Tax=Rotaria magnacalcarata TaxID=392030 RepID=A0A816WXW1_9BILA|nr:unnamed protein product [Rotaria magnacalcarata]CAF2139990.1 unnamed protein product [Rotaria magnacalcarata]CAF3772909.1 unnamed protein product [Rotaria magnacalcarata]CAF3781152.1 unnamed protein product [Rotaria magnacalcarata]